MRIDDVATLVTQKGFSGSSGVLGLYIVWDSELSSVTDIGAALIGVLLVALAVVIEYLMWKQSTHIYRERINSLEQEKRKTDDRIATYDQALIDFLSRKRN